MNREANEKTTVTSEKENPFENWSGIASRYSQFAIRTS